MSSSSSSSSHLSGKHLAKGSFRVFLAEALIFPTGLIVTIYLTRRLGPVGYGLFTLAAVITVWLERSLTEFFGRATIKFVGESRDWRSVGATIVRLHLVSSVFFSGLLWFLSASISEWLREPHLEIYLKIFAIDIPIFLIARAYRNLLVGIGDFGARAMQSVGRWVSRMCLIILFVELGFSVTGAVIGCILASAVECIIGAKYMRLPLSHPSPISIHKFWGYSIPIFVSTVLLVLFQRLDLFMLKIMGGSTELAGIYGAAQTVYLLYGVITLSIAPLLLSTVTRNLREKRDEDARRLSSDVVRLVILILPFAAILSGSAFELVPLVFGMEYSAASPIVSILVFSMLSLVIMTISASIMTAYGKPLWSLFLFGPLPWVALVSQMVFIPRYGAVGAATTTTFLAILGAITGLFILSHAWKIHFPKAVLIKTLIIAGGVYLPSIYWSMPGFMLLIKIPSLCVIVVIALIMFATVKRQEVEYVLSAIRRKNTA